MRLFILAGLICLGFLFGCTNDGVAGDGNPDVLIFNPLCAVFCVTTVNAADTDTQGQGNTNSTSQSVSTGQNQ